VETAQTRFARTVRELLAPALREIGFRGSGQEYELPSDSHWAVLGIQRSRHSDRTKVIFTVNISVVKKSTWNEIREATREWKVPLGRMPSANANYSTLQWQDRLGALMPGTRGDKWWELGQDDDPAGVVNDVLAAIRDYGLPALRARIGTS
jgi:hypothetical protein